MKVYFIVPGDTVYDGNHGLVVKAIHENVHTVDHDDHWPYSWSTIEYVNGDVYTYPESLDLKVR